MSAEPSAIGRGQPSAQPSASGSTSVRFSEDEAAPPKCWLAACCMACW